MKKNYKRTLLDLVIEIIGLVIVGVVVWNAQTLLSVNRQSENSQAKLDVAHQRLELHQTESEDYMDRYNSFSQAKTDTLAYYYDLNPEQASNINAMAEQWGLKELYIITPQYQVVSSNGAQPINFGEDKYKELFSSDKPYAEGDMRYYLSKMANGNLLIGGRDSKEANEEVKKSTSPEYSLHNIKVGKTGYISAVKTSNGIIEYSPNASIIGKNLDEAGLDSNVLKDGFKGWINPNSGSFYCECREVGDYFLVALVSKAEINEYNLKIVITILAILTIVVTFIIIYVYLLRKEELENLDSNTEVEYIKFGKKLFLNQSIFVKLRNVMIIGLIVIFAVSYFAQSLVSLSRQNVRSDLKLNDITTTLDENKEKLSKLTEEYTKEYERRAKNIAYLFAQSPKMVNSEIIQTLTNKVQIRDIFVFNDKGTIDATDSAYSDFTLSTTPGEQSYEFWDIIKGHKDVIVQDATEDVNADNGMTQFVGVKRLDAPGVIQLGINPQRLKNRVATTQLNYVLGNIAVENEGMIIAINKDDKKLSFFKEDDYTGHAMTDIGLEESILIPNYSGYQSINGSKYFLTGMNYDDQFIYIAIPTSNIIKGRLLMSGIVALASFILLLVLLLPLLFSTTMDENKEDSENSKTNTEEPKKEPRGMIEIVTSSGKKRKVQSVLSRWGSSNKEKWNEINAEQKFMRIIKITLSVLAIAMVFFVVKIKNSYNHDSIFSYIINKKWEKVPNIFSLTYIAMIFVEVLVITGILRAIINAMVDNFGARAETIGKLISNFIKYASVIGVIFYCLSCVGVDSSSLIASAGILTLVVGLGAKSLVSDILAGMFIVFEGEFRVGDIITIDNWRGTVLEIGIHSTKVEDVSKNIKIFNNSAINNVINMTRKYSFASVDIGVEYGESLEHVESILRSELPLMKKRIKAIEAGPFYKGVVALADSSVNIRIIAQCQENDRIQVTRDLNRAMKILFDRYKISIPYPQVVLNQPVEHRTATLKERHKANEFINEQNEATKEMHVSSN